MANNGMGRQVKNTVTSRKDLRPQTSDKAPINGALRNARKPCKQETNDQHANEPVWLLTIPPVWHTAVNYSSLEEAPLTQSAMQKTAETAQKPLLNWKKIYFDKHTRSGKVFHLKEHTYCICPLSPSHPELDHSSATYGVEKFCWPPVMDNVLHEDLKMVLPQS